LTYIYGMNNKSWIQILREELQKPLPGWEAQQLMSPPSRKALQDYIDLINPQTKKSAVSLILTEKNNQKSFVLIKKTSNSGSHSGQFGLPGGKVEPNDPNYIYTAFRETQEEIGLTLNHDNLLGKLSEMFIPPTNYLIYPYISFVEEINEVKLQEEEIEDLFFIPIASLLDPKNIMEMEFMTSYAFKVTSPCYDLNGCKVWGATAMILSEFAAVAKKTF
jgi:8-oxo-dGTP pyrophosphatase MutT (NUDIX family)